MKRLGVAALRPMLTFGNKGHLAKMCAEGLEMFLVECFFDERKRYWWAGCPLFGVKSRTTQITPRWGYLSIP